MFKHVTKKPHENSGNAQLVAFLDSFSLPLRTLKSNVGRYVFMQQYGQYISKARNDVIFNNKLFEKAEVLDLVDQDGIFVTRRLLLSFFGLIRLHFILNIDWINLNKSRE